MASASEPFTGDGALDGNWTTQFGLPGRVSGEFGALNSAFDAHSAYYSGLTWANDHYAQATIKNATAGQYEKYCQVNVRVTSGGNFYSLYTDGYDGHTGDSGHTAIAKNVSGSETILQGLPAFGQNDVMKLEAVGTTLKAYKNGAQTGSDQSDASLSSGAPGILIFPNTPRMDDWSAADVGGGGGISIPVVQAYRRMMGMR